MKYSIAFIAILAVTANSFVAPVSASKGNKKKDMPRQCVNKPFKFEVKLKGGVVAMRCDDVDSKKVCNAKLNKGKKRVKDLCPVSCEQFKKIKVGKKNNKKTVICGTMDTDTMCKKKHVQKKCKNACGQCPTTPPTLAPTVAPTVAPTPASNSCVKNVRFKLKVRLDGEDVGMNCHDVDSKKVCNAMAYEKRVKNLCPVSCEQFEKIKVVGKNNKKEIVLCGTMDTDTMCEKRHVQKKCKNACGQCPTPTLAPTVSINPSSSPNTLDPTDAPTSAPTNAPTSAPTGTSSVDTTWN